MTLALTTDSYEDFLNQADKPVVIDFWAQWCGPCKRVSPLFDEIGQERTDVIVTKVDVDAEQAIARTFSISAMPTFIIVYAGAVVARSTGARPKETLNAWIDEALAKLELP